ncbi:MAG TPA: NAD(P)/FAD-dependent oxidoreductase [Streptomyces sp.]|jgi:phytoene dehydrogenase-like protein|nr:NAD(P)/FAD-dependent oxidoreductase [Streptomyces sp.]
MARIAVIGAGMGAMAAAARLAVAGNRVTVCEQSATYGGAVRRHRRDGFGFDTGPGLLHLPAVYRDLFVKTGKQPLEECVALRQVDPAARHHFADGTVVTLPAVSRAGICDALDAALGAGAGDRWSELLNRGRTVWEATRRPLLEEPLLPGGARLTADPYPAARRGLLRRRPTTLSAVGRAELRDPRLVALLESFARSHGLDPERTPASATVLPYLEQTFGNWYVRGGMRALARALYERCLARGVEFRFEARATRVTEAGGRATGVELADGEAVEADVVIAGTPLPGDPAGPAAPGQARLTVLAALRGARPAGVPHRTFVHTARRLVTVLRPDDPLLRPDDVHESAVLSTAVPGPVDDPQRLADELLAAAEDAGLGLADRLLWRVVRTPADDEADTLSPGGLVPAPALAGADGAFLHAPNRGALHGLYRAGGWAHPGGGQAHAGMSGALAAGLVIEGDAWRGSQ